MASLTYPLRLYITWSDGGWEITGELYDIDNLNKVVVVQFEYLIEYEFATMNDIDDIVSFGECTHFHLYIDGPGLDKVMGWEAKYELMEYRDNAPSLFKGFVPFNMLKHQAELWLGD